MERIAVNGTRSCIFCGKEPPIYLSDLLSLFSGGLLQNIGQIGQDVIGQDQQEGEEGRPHRYSYTVWTLCSPDAAFNSIRMPSLSAPMAPYAREGERAVMLAGNNPIIQIVDSRQRQIVNVTQPGHTFHPGEVTWQVESAWIGSTITVTGTGTGRNPNLNNLTGMMLFVPAAGIAALHCQVTSASGAMRG